MRKLILNALNSWITSVALGVPGLAVTWQQVHAAIDGDDATTWSWAALITGVGLIIGGLVSRDGNKSSEDVKVK
jgi:hypothetical protein